MALIATNLSRRLRQQRDRLASQQEEAEKLYALNRAMLFSEGGNIRRLIVNKCVELFGFQEVALFESATGHIQRSGKERGIPEEILKRVSRSGAAERNAANACAFLPVTLGNRSFGSLGLCGQSLPERTLQAVGNTIAVGLAQAQAQEAGSRAEAVRRNEELKSVMIDALAHDLKSPLTAIEAAADMLLGPVRVTPEQHQDLVEVIQQEARGLRIMLNEAIHLARIDADRMRLDRVALAVRELIETAIQSLGGRAASHQIDVEIPLDLPPVWADSELIAQAVKQVLDNAIKYSPSRSRITVSAEERNGLIAISIRDRGAGLTELEQAHVFDKFYRGRYDRSAVQGTGMGLAITKEIVEAHGGSAAVESQVGEGSRFTIALPPAQLPIESGQQRA